MFGGKGVIIEPLLEALIVYNYLKRRLKLWQLAFIALPTLFLTFGVMNFYRFVVIGNSPPRNVADVISRVESAADLLAHSDESFQQEPSALDQMVTRDAGVDALALILKYTPDPFPYQYGRDLVQIPLNFVPRGLWKDKPLSSGTQGFERTYMGMPASFNGFSSPHLISDFYRNFSIYGVVVGMFLAGVGFRWVYLICAPSRDNYAGVFFYAAILPGLSHTFEVDAAATTFEILKSWSTLILIAIFLGVRYRRATPGN
jgi:hypothetical protein